MLEVRHRKLIFGLYCALNRERTSVLLVYFNLLATCTMVRRYAGQSKILIKTNLKPVRTLMILPPVYTESNRNEIINDQISKLTGMENQDDQTFSRCFSRAQLGSTYHYGERLMHHAQAH